MTKDMTQGSPVRLIVEFALPLLFGMLFQQLYNFVDTMIVGRFLGVTALAGVGATGSINFLVLGFCMGLSAGFCIPVAQQFGAKEESRMRQFAANGAWLAVAFSAVMTAATVVFCRDILTMMNTPSDCFEEAYSYIVVIFAGIPFIFVYNLLSGYLRSLGDSRTPLMFLALSSLMNVVLDLAFILIFHMGIMGAALATVVSQAVSGLLCLLFIVRRVPILHISREEWQLRTDRIAVLCAYGIPMGMQYSITAVGTVVLQVAVNSLGSLAVAAMTAAIKVLNFLGCPFEALGTTMATYSAQNVGASRYDRLNRGVFAASGLGCAYFVAALAVAWFFGRGLTQLFVADGGTELIELARQFMLIEVSFYPLLMLVNVVRFSIQGMGFSGFAVIAGVLEMIARSIAAVAFVPVLGFLGVCFASPLAWAFADVFLIPAYFRCKKKMIARVHHLHTIR